jgi:RND family efflux transporter MFP subunit
MDSNHRRARFLIIGIILLLSLLFIIGFMPRYFEDQKTEALAESNPLPKVSVTKIVANTKPFELVLPTSAAPLHTTPIWSRVNGYLLRFLVDIGDIVKKGDLLAEIDTPETDEDLARAKADLLNAQAIQEIAKITQARWEALWNKNREAVSKQEVDQYLANLQAANATVLANEKVVSRLTFQQQFKFIYAPFDGIITKRNVDIGTLIYGNINGAPEELFEIAQTDIIRFFVQVPQNYFQQIQDGIEVEAGIQELPNHIFRGTVTRFARALDPTARTLLTQIDVENQDNLLFAGVFGRIKFLLKPAASSVIIPTSALIIRSGPPTVAIVDANNIVHIKEVRIGKDSGKYMEIISGIVPGDSIITLPSDQIREGVKVVVDSNQGIDHI